MEDVVTCTSPKFVAAPTLCELNQAAKEGKENLAVVGTPCQVTALAQMRLNPLHRPDFKDPVAMTIGLFCTWALDTRGLLDLLKDRLDIEQIKKMDLPPPPSEILVLETGDGRTEILLSQIRPLIPEGCHICPDMTSEWADLSVGVVEGRPQWNTLIIRTDRAHELVEEARIAGWLVTAGLPEENLGHLRLAAGNKKRRAWDALDKKGLLNTDGVDSRAAIRVNSEALTA